MNWKISIREMCRHGSKIDFSQPNNKSRDNNKNIQFLKQEKQQQLKDKKMI